MPKRKSKKKRQVVNQKFVKALAHELRVEILGILTERVASPNELAKDLGKGLSGVSYHVGVLNDYGLITLVDTAPRRGALEHYYRATASTLLPAQEWRGVDGGLRTAIGAGLASELFDGLAGAVEANKLTDADTHVGRTLLVLDAEGWKNVRASAEQFTKAVEREQRESAKRAATANGEAGVRAYTVGVLAFEDSRDLPQKAKRSRRSKAAAGRGKGVQGRRKAKTSGKSRGASKRKP